MNKSKAEFFKSSIVSYGAAYVEGGINFCAFFKVKRALFLCLYRGNDCFLKIDMQKHRLAGDAYSVTVDIRDAARLSYLYELDGKLIRDPYEKSVYGIRPYGKLPEDETHERSSIYFPDFDWQNDVHPGLSYKDVIAYSLHVRGFTRHSSSKVKAKGTYRGIIEKIPYLKELGISQLVLLPAYYFDEFDIREKTAADPTLGMYEKADDIPRINYWGFKEGHYFLPKPQYAYSEDFISEFKTMVRELHKAGIELVMQFYFPDEVNRNMIIDCLKFWAIEYHVDGFYLKGENLPLDLIATDLSLSGTKIYYGYYDKDNIFRNKSVANENLAFLNNDYQDCMRKYLKSDEDMLKSFLNFSFRNPSDIHAINYICQYEGFTLNDLVSYDYKHNEDNGEDNRDGNDYNYSWNCGMEGPSRKKQILSLRLKQMKNAFMFLLLSQGVPMILAGDEFMNSQNGNNNPYCQDNEISWVNWKHTKEAMELNSFVKELIALRRGHPVLHMEEALRMMDYAACGYPDLSYHGELAWRPRTENHIRNIGVMLCGKYIRINRTKEDDFFYIAYNMHWQNHLFGLPKLHKGLKWKPELCSDSEDLKEMTLKDDAVCVSARSVLVLRSVNEL